MPAKAAGSSPWVGLWGLAARRLPLPSSCFSRSRLPPTVGAAVLREASPEGRSRAVRTSELPDPDRFADGAVLVSQAEAEVLNRTRRPNPTGQPCSLQGRSRALCGAPTGQRPGTQPGRCSAWPHTREKGSGSGGEPDGGGKSFCRFCGFCPYVSSVVGAEVGAARLWRLPADLFSGRPMAVTDIASLSSSALSDTVLRCSARAWSSSRAREPARTRTANRTGLPCSAWTGEGWVAPCVTGTCSRPEGRSRSGGRCRRRCRSENASDVGADGTGPHPAGHQSAS